MGRFRERIYRWRSIFVYGALMALLVLVLKWLQWKFLLVDHSVEVYAGLIAVLFTAFGVWIATQLTRSRVRTVAHDVPLPAPAGDAVNTEELEKLQLSDREYEVLLLIAKGCSNAEIAAQLFLSVSTVKTHVSNLFVKMEVRSRTQAMEKAQRLKIVQ